MNIDGGLDDGARNTEETNKSIENKILNDPSTAPEGRSWK